ncbi:MAG: hypothetical protein LAO03_04255 [Acidobacteriia bacterium]|nr:hypothetical protein [Terriglobia bacterium]
MFSKYFRTMLVAVLLGGGLTSLAWGQEWRVRNGDGDINGTELRNFDEFLDSHSAIQSELSRNPGLAENPGYLAQHPEFREFLQRHSGVREELRENPSRFLRADRRWDRRQDWRDRDRDDHRSRDRDDRRDGDHDRDHRRLRDRDDRHDHDGDRR